MLLLLLSPIAITYTFILLHVPCTVCMCTLYINARILDSTITVICFSWMARLEHTLQISKWFNPNGPFYEKHFCNRWNIQMDMLYLKMRSRLSVATFACCISKYFENEYQQFWSKYAFCVVLFHGNCLKCATIIIRINTQPQDELFENDFLWNRIYLL